MIIHYLFSWMGVAQILSALIGVEIWLSESLENPLNDGKSYARTSMNQKRFQKPFTHDNHYGFLRCDPISVKVIQRCSTTWKHFSPGGTMLGLICLAEFILMPEGLEKCEHASLVIDQHVNLNVYLHGCVRMMSDVNMLGVVHQVELCVYIRIQLDVNYVWPNLTERFARVQLRA